MLCCALIYQIIQPNHKNATKLMLTLLPGQRTDLFATCFWRLPRNWVPSDTLTPLQSNFGLSFFHYNTVDCWLRPRAPFPHDVLCMYMHAYYNHPPFSIEFKYINREKMIAVDGWRPSKKRFLLWVRYNMLAIVMMNHCVHMLRQIMIVWGNVWYNSHGWYKQLTQ